MATIRIHTTQNVTLEYEVASIGSRIAATVLDNLIIGAWAIAIVLLVTQAAHLRGEVAAWIMGVLVGLPFVFYNLASEILFDGQSLGKKAQHLRVVRLDGTSPRLGDYFLRWLLRLVDFSIGSGLVAVITIAVNGKGQRIGDLAAGTTVISVRPRPGQLANVASPATPAGYQPVFPQAADLSDHDVALLRQLLGRTLQHDNYLLLNETATKVKSLLNIQTDLGDEPFLRTILRDQAHLASEGEPAR